MWVRNLVGGAEEISIKSKNGHRVNKNQTHHMRVVTLYLFHCELVSPHISGRGSTRRLGRRRGQGREPSSIHNNLSFLLTKRDNLTVTQGGDLKHS